MYSPHHTPNTSPKKPSPLSYATSSNPSSPRASPFKRAQSPAITNNTTQSPVPVPGPITPRARARTPSQTVRAGTSAAPAPDLSRSPTRDGFAPSPRNDTGFGGSIGRDSARQRTPDVSEVFGDNAAAVTKGEGASPAVPLAAVGHWSPSSAPASGSGPGSGTSMGAGMGVGGPRPPPNSGAPAGHGENDTGTVAPHNTAGAVRSGSPAPPISARGTRPLPQINNTTTIPNPRSAMAQAQTTTPTTNSPRHIESTQTKPTKSSVAFASTTGGADAMSKIHPARLREMHESFQVLDRDSDGLVDRSDVAEMLAQLGQPNDPVTLNDFLPTATPPTHTNLPTYLSTLTTLLSPVSSLPELSAAFSAFDTDDSGQIDASELRAALVQGYDGAKGLDDSEVEGVLEEFGGRRMFGGKRTGGMVGGIGGQGSGGAGGEVFRWREFVGAVAGGGNGSAGVESGAGERDGVVVA